MVNLRKSLFSVFAGSLLLCGVHGECRANDEKELNWKSALAKWGISASAIWVGAKCAFAAGSKWTKGLEAKDELKEKFLSQSRWYSSAAYGLIFFGGLGLSWAGGEVWEFLRRVVKWESLSDLQKKKKYKKKLKEELKEKRKNQKVPTFDF